MSLAAQVYSPKQPGSSTVTRCARIYYSVCPKKSFHSVASSLFRGESFASGNSLSVISPRAQDNMLHFTIVSILPKSLSKTIIVTVRSYKKVGESQTLKEFLGLV